MQLWVSLLCGATTLLITACANNTETDSKSNDPPAGVAVRRVRKRPSRFSVPYDDYEDDYQDYYSDSDISVGSKNKGKDPRKITGNKENGDNDYKIIINKPVKVNLPKEKEFYLGVDKQLNWFGAVQKCKSMKKRPASINSQRDQDLLVQTIKSKGLCKNRFWIGASDLATKGHFVWSDGKPMSYTNWYPGEPNNYCNNENCVEVVVDQGYKWNDFNCWTPLYYICEDYC